MSLEQVITRIQDRNIGVLVEDGKLVIRAPQGAMDAETLALFKAHKQALLKALQDKDSNASLILGANRSSSKITPEKLPLVDLSQEDIDSIIARVRGGEANIQDIYPLAPLQEGILFHHVLETQGDTYLLRSVLAFNTRENLECFIAALQQVINRHDILRSGIFWEDLPQPVQVVFREACLPVYELEIQIGDALTQLLAATDPCRVRLDFHRAPLLAAYTLAVPESGEWLLALLSQHIVCDHISLEFIIEEIRLLLQGRSDKLTTPVPYRNFIAQLRAVSSEQHEAYFRRQLGDVTEPTIPFGLLDVKNTGAVSETHSIISDTLAQKIRVQAKQYGVTSATLFHAAWARVLAQACGQQDVVFGTVLAGRMQGAFGTEKTLGMFINTLPVRINVGDIGIRHAIATIHHNLSELLVHEQAPLSLVQRCSGVDGLLPLFTSLLNYRHSRRHDDALAAWNGMRIIVGGEERTNYPITLSVDDFGDGFGLTLQCINSALSARLNTYMLTSIQAIIDALAVNPDLPMCAISIVAEDEERQQLKDWNSNKAEYPQDRCIQQLFEAQVEQMPDAMALSFEDQQLSYAELNAKANQLAHYLMHGGVGADILVGIHLERSLEMVISLLGVLKAGGAYVPLDPHSPEERLTFMLADLKPSVLITQGLLTGHDLGSAQVFDWAQDRGKLESYLTVNPSPALQLTNLAYCIYTSGSTGQPKAAGVGHQAILNRLQWMQAEYRLVPSDRVLQKTPYSFDVSVWEFFWPLLAGAYLVVARPELHKDSLGLIELIRREQITTIHFVPSMLQAFVDTPDVEQCTSLKRVFCSGEALSADLVRGFQQKLSAELHNLYGPTEAAVDVSYWACPPDCRETAIPIGKPISNLRLYILDRSLNLVPVGTPGELHIAGIGLGRGYLNRPHLTAEKFIPDPFGPSGSRLYKTGDLVRYRLDGNIDYLGRMDHQVKIRGFRIELGEIEAQLRQHPAVHEAVVLAREDQPGDKRLVAYLLEEQAGGLQIDELKAQLTQNLPDYMIPSIFMLLEQMPVSANGKLDRKKLPVPNFTQPLKKSYVAPRTETEQTLTGVFERVLGVDKVGIDDSFFELGGDSIRSLQIINAVKKLGFSLSLADLYKTPTIREITDESNYLHNQVELLSVKRCFELVDPEDLIKMPKMVEDAYPLTTLQAGMIFHSEYDQFAYHLIDSARLKCKLDIDALKQVIDQVMNRHPVLRTCFDFSHYIEPLQLVYRAEALPNNVFYTDWQALNEQQQIQKYSSWFEQEKEKVFDICHAPLIRFYVHKLNHAEFQFTVVEHHAILDGWSLVSMLNEIFSNYLSTLRPSSLSHKSNKDILATNALRDLVVWEQAAISSEICREYWLKKLDEATYHSLPSFISTTSPGVVQNKQYHKITGKLSDVLTVDLTKNLLALSKKLSVPIKTLLLTAHLKVLGMLYGEQRIVSGLVCSVRPETLGADQSLGVFLNTLPFVINLNTSSWHELIRQTFASERELMRYRFYPLAKIQREYKKESLFDVMFHYLDYHIANDLMKSNDLEVLKWDEHVDAINTLGVAFLLDSTASTVRMEFLYDTSKLTETQVQSISAYYKLVLTDIIQNIDCRHDRRSLISDLERGSVYDWNDTKLEYPQDRCIQQLFEAHAEQTPDAIALSFEDQQLSYAELNAKANQLAHYLMHCGVGADVLVGIHLERSLEMVISLLGVLKAGGAYLPLDPNSPEERLRFMLADIKPSVVITQGPLTGHDLGLAQMFDWAHDRRKIESSPDVNPSPALQLTNLAYCIYTSGSTGQPKAAGVPHQAILNRLQWMQAEYRLDTSDRVLQKTPYSFDVSVWEFFWPLLAGAHLVVARPELHKDSLGLIALIRREQITTIHFVPSMLQAFVDTLDVEQCTSLKQVFCSGEALSADLVQGFQQKLSAELHNLYGPTEAAVDVSYWACPADCRETAIPIGKPISNLRLYILDHSLNVVPVGTPGELHIAGLGLGRGYLNRPHLTAEKFIPDPFGPSGSRLYKTGDLVRYRLDGNIDYLGRMDHQVKIRGFRIELGEIEAQLRQHPAVHEAVVLAREDQPGDKRLVAYLLEAQAGGLQIDELKAQLTQSLPDYMIPSIFMLLEKMPVSANGKLDRKRLPAPEWSALSTCKYAAPQGEVESALAEVWQVLLGIDKISRNAHFFELGGHSLLVITMIQRLRERGLAVDARSVFATPILADMAKAMVDESTSGANFVIPPNLLESAPFDGEHTQAFKITPEKLPLIDLSQTDIDHIVANVSGGAANIQDIYPLAPLQEGILFHHLLDTQGDTYLLRSVLAFENHDYLVRFIAALEQVISHHDILRSAVLWEDLPQALQVVYRTAPLPVHELEVQGGNDAMTQLLAATDPYHLRLNLCRAPLLAAYTIADPQNGEWLLALLSHHLICDHISLEFIIAEIRSLFLGQVDLLSPSIPYRNFIAQLGRRSSEEDEIYFRQQLSDVTEPTAPFGMLDVKSIGEITEESFSLPKNQSQQIRAQAKKFGVSPAALFHLAWAQVLAQCCGRDDVVFGTVLTGRMHGSAGVERTIGMFINTLPIRMKVGDITVQQAVVEIHKNLTELLAHEQASLTLVLRCSGINNSAPLFTTILNYRHIQAIDLSRTQENLEGLRTIIGGEERSNYPITFSVNDFGDLFGFTVQCVIGISPSRLIRWVCSAIESLLAGLINASNKPIKLISILPEEEYKQLIYDWNSSSTEHPENWLIHQFFEAQAISAPSAIALSFDGQHLSYAELNAKANQLAHFLIDQGVGPDVLVGIYIERSLEMVIGLLGILKAGGAYVPLDPTYPKERTAMIFANANVSILLSRAGLLETLEKCCLDSESLFSRTASRGLQSICLDSDWPIIAKYSAMNPMTRVYPLNLAYMIYTSGSTGQPKGVAVNHHNAVNSTWARFKYYPDAVQAYLLLSSFAFDSSVAGIFWTLSQGGHLCLANEIVSRDPVALAALIDTQQISHVLALPSLYQLLMEQAPTKLHSLKVVIVAGEACNTEVVKRHFEILSQTKLYNEYGPTEGSVWSSVYQASLEDIGCPLAIGRPIENVQIYILDPNLNPVPVGVAGELYIGGAGIVRGYWQLPELSAERFIPDPFQVDGGRLYRTGDWVRYRADSVIEFLGRIDYQVKIRGFRIELGEIEAVLLKHPDVKEAVVIADEDRSGNNRLLAYLISSPLGVLQVDDLKAQLQQVLPDFMVPSAFIVLESMPLSANGKLDRKQLPKPEVVGQLKKPYLAPRTEIESILVTVWQQILTVDQVGIEDDFFALGGHSLLAAKLAFAIEKALQAKFPVKAVFENPSIVQQARWLNGIKDREEAVNLNFEAELDSDIWPLAAKPIAITQSSALLLTGATGFLGGFLLLELLKQTKAKVYCLIRASDEAQALHRLQQQLRRYELIDQIDWLRVIPVCGDLAHKRLGLTENRYLEIAANVDAIFHNGALVNFVQTYQSLKATNVLSGVEVLRLAATARSKAIHYVSTLSVFAGSPANLQGFKETDEPLLNDALTGGYAQSKWVAEKQFRLAQQRGFQITIYRPATVAGDSINGVWNLDDFMCRILKGCIQMGLVPDVYSHLDMAPVDEISRAIVTLAQLTNSESSIYHLNHPNPPTADIVFDWFIAHGLPLCKVPSRQWHTQVQASAKIIANFALTPLLSLFVDEVISDDQTAQDELVRYDCTLTQGILARHGVAYTAINKLLLKRYLDYFVRCGFIEVLENENNSEIDMGRRRSSIVF